MSISSLAFGASALSLAQVARLIAQAIAVPWLARYLSPADFGLVAMATPFVLFVQIFGDAGLGLSLLRSKNQSQDLWSTAFWVVLGVGICLGMVLLAVGPLSARLLSTPELKEIIWALALVPVLQSLSSIHATKLYEEERISFLAFMEAMSVLASVCCAVALAVSGFGIWALVAQQLAYYVVRLALTIFHASPIVSRKFKFRLLHGHLRFGRNIVLFKLVDFFSRSVDALIIGKTLGPVAAGYYVVAVSIVRLPRMIVTTPISTVLYPRMAKLHQDIATVRSLFLASSRLMAAAIIPAMAIAATEAHSAFAVLLSEKWIPAAIVYTILTPVNAIMAVTALNGTVLMAIGRTDIQLRTGIEYTAFRLLAVFLSSWAGLNVLAIVLNVVFAVYFYRFCQFFLPTIDCKFTTYLKTLVVPTVFAVVFAVGHCLLASTLDLGFFGRLTSATLILLACWVTMFFFMRRTLSPDFSYLKLKLGDGNHGPAAVEPAKPHIE